MIGDEIMSKEYKAESMIKNSRHINYFNTLDGNIKNDILKRIDELVAEEMFKFVQQVKKKCQKLSKKSLFWTVIKKIVPIGLKKGSGIGWRYTWHNDTPKNEFRFETNECIYQKILSKRVL